MGRRAHHHRNEKGHRNPQGWGGDVGTERDGGNHVFLVNDQGEQYINATGVTGYPFFGDLILDSLNCTENAMTQACAFKAAELCLIAQKQAEMVYQAK